MAENDDFKGQAGFYSKRAVDRQKEGNRAQETFNNLAEKALNLGQQNVDNIEKKGRLESTITNEYRIQLELAELFNEHGVIRNDVTTKELKTRLENVDNLKKEANVIADNNLNMIDFGKKLEDARKTYESIQRLAKTPLGLVSIGVAVAAVFAKVQEAVTNTRKELGVSQTQAAGIALQNKAIGIFAKGYGLSLENDILPAQQAIRKDLGASVQESINLSLNFARTAAATGQTADELTTTLSLMESISSASRDVLLNQLRTTAAIAGKAGVTPALVMKDLSQNAEFFASFAKDGGMNIVNASIAARKLGLELSAAADMANSLLDFESSIEAQLEASLLLGRQINMDKARQLAFTGDIEGMQREILKQVGGEAEFAKMSYLQRQKTAAAAGTTVENLARLVRNNTTGATGAAAGAAMSGGGDNRMLNTTVEMKDEIKGLRRDIRDR